MGNKQSILTYNRLRPFLPFSSRYNRLPSSDLQEEEPLLVDEGYYERKEKQNYEIEALWKKNVTLEKNHGLLEKEIRQMQSIVSRLESAAVTGSSTSKASSKVAPGNGCGSKTMALELEKDPINQLRLQLSDYQVVEKVSTVTMAKKQQDVIEKLQQKSASLEHKVADLTASLHHLKKKMHQIELSPQKSTTSRLPLPGETTRAGFPIPAAKIEKSILVIGNDIVIGCLLTLIFLVSVLIGLNL